ncbi:hypothetical protein CB1_000613008 [Camelus ferus]|nr:hypothetical protein CB1_000613008 [Camelus ferus]
METFTLTRMLSLMIQLLRVQKREKENGTTIVIAFLDRDLRKLTTVNPPLTLQFERILINNEIHSRISTSEKFLMVRDQQKRGVIDSTCFIDVVFIVDSSESSKLFLFDKQKDFVDSLSDRVFQLTPAGSLKYDIKLAALQFSSSVQIDPPFSSWKDLQTFQQRVKSMNFIGQGTFSYYAISNATHLLKREGRQDGVKVALLMTDGIDHPKNPDVRSISEDARTAGILFITIGLSPVVNETKLRLISGDSPNEPILLLNESSLVDKIQDRLDVLFEKKCERKICECEKGDPGDPGPPGDAQKGEPGERGPGGSTEIMKWQQKQKLVVRAPDKELLAGMDPQGQMDQRDPEDFRVSLVLLVLMVLQEPLVLDSKVLRGKEARKEELGLQDQLVLVSRARQVPVGLWEPQERGAYQEKDFQDPRVKKALKDQLVHKDYKACQSKGTRYYIQGIE